MNKAKRSETKGKQVTVDNDQTVVNPDIRARELAQSIRQGNIRSWFELASIAVNNLGITEDGKLKKRMDGLEGWYFSLFYRTDTEGQRVLLSKEECKECKDVPAYSYAKKIIAAYKTYRADDYTDDEINENTGGIVDFLKVAKIKKDEDRRGEWFAWLNGMDIKGETKGKPETNWKLLSKEYQKTVNTLDEKSLNVLAEMMGKTLAVLVSENSII